MKYLFLLLVIICLVATGVFGYLVLSQKYAGPASQNPPAANSSDDISSLKAQIAGFQEKIAKLEDLVVQQSLFAQSLKQENVEYGAKIVTLEKKFSQSLSNLIAESKSMQLNQNQDIRNPPSMNNNPFNPNPIVRPPVNQANEFNVDLIQRQKEEHMAKIQQQTQARITQGINEIAKVLFMTDYQKEEFTKLVGERKIKHAELFDQIQNKQMNVEDFRTKYEVLRTEYNDKIKGLITSQQYEQYQKEELAWNKKLMFTDIPGPANPTRKAPPKK